MIKFEDAHEATQYLDYLGVAKGIVGAAFRIELEKATAKALMSAR